MWKMIFFLWLVPIVLASIPLARMANGSQPIRARERRLFFGKSGHSSLTAWGWFGLVILAFGFFCLGVIQAVILLNLSAFWTVITPLFTGAVAVAFSVLLLRTRGSRRSAVHRSSRRAPSFTRRLDDLFSR